MSSLKKHLPLSSGCEVCRRFGKKRWRLRRVEEGKPKLIKSQIVVLGGGNKTVVFIEFGLVDWLIR
jgi:hypothetical protein